MSAHPRKRFKSLRPKTVEMTGKSFYDWSKSAQRVSYYLVGHVDGYNFPKTGIFPGVVLSANYTLCKFCEKMY